MEIAIVQENRKKWDNQKWRKMKMVGILKSFENEMGKYMTLNLKQRELKMRGMEMKSQKTETVKL